MLSDAYHVAAMPTSGLRRRHSGDKHTHKLFGDLQQDSQLYRQNSSQSTHRSKSSHSFQIVEHDACQMADLSPAEVASTTAALSSSSEQSSSSKWASSGVLKRISSLGSALPRVQLPLLSSVAATAAASSSSSSCRHEDAPATAVETTSHTAEAAHKRGAHTVSVAGGCMSEDESSSTAVSSADLLHDVAAEAGPKRDQSAKTEFIICLDTGNYMEVAPPTGSAGTLSTKRLITSAAGFAGHGMKVSKDPRKSE